jgi:hypothetical protein
MQVIPIRADGERGRHGQHRIRASVLRLSTEARPDEQCRIPGETLGGQSHHGQIEQRGKAEEVLARLLHHPVI